MICPNCQTNVQDGSPFCPRCGMQFQYQQQQPQYPPPGYPTPQGGYAPQPAGFGGGYGGSAAAPLAVTVEHGSAFALAVLALQPEQSVQTESGAMVSMSANVEIQSKMQGGLMGALKRAVAGESAFVSTFTARGGPGELTLAPSCPGDIIALTLSNQSFFVQGGSFLACSPTITIDTKFGGGKAFFSGEGLFLIGASGSGTLLVSSFGAIRKKTLAPGEQYIVDTGHIVAFESTIQYSLQKAAAGFFRSMTSGEGIVARYVGPGDIYLQTRSLEAFAGILKPFFPTQGSGGSGFNFGS